MDEHTPQPAESNQMPAVAASERFAAVNAGRHERIAPLVEETDSGFLGAYEVIEGDAISL